VRATEDLKAYDSNHPLEGSLSLYQL